MYIPSGRLHKIYSNRFNFLFCSLPKAMIRTLKPYTVKFRRPATLIDTFREFLHSLQPNAA
jgi:hypothetical protein